MHPEVRQVVEELNPAQLVLEACLCPAPDLKFEGEPLAAARKLPKSFLKERKVATRNDRDMGYRS